MKFKAQIPSGDEMFFVAYKDFGNFKKAKFIKMLKLTATNLVTQALQKPSPCLWIELTFPASLKKVS